MTAPEPAAPPAQDELRSALIAALRLWLYPEDGEGGHLYRERIATQQAERATAALLAGPLAGLVAERDALVVRRLDACHGMTRDRPGEARAYREGADWLRAALGGDT